MSALNTIWALSSAGAVAFYLAGYVSSSLRRPPQAGESDPRALPPVDVKAVEEIRAELERERGAKQAAQAELGRVKDSALKARAEIDNLNQQLQSQGFAAQKFLGEQSSFQEQLEQYRRDIDKHQTEAQRLQRELEQLRSSRAGATGSEVDLERKLRQTAEAERLDLSRKLEKLAQQLEEAKARIKAERDARVAAEEERATVAAQIPKLRTENTQLASRLQRQGDAGQDKDSSELARLRKETAAQRDKLQKVETELRQAEQLKAQHQALTAENKELKARIELVATQAQNARNEAEELRAELGSLQDEVDATVTTTREFAAPTPSQPTEGPDGASNRKTTQQGVMPMIAVRPPAEDDDGKLITDTHDEARELLIKLQTAEAKAKELEDLKAEHKRVLEELQGAKAEFAVDGAGGADEARLAAVQAELRETKIKVQTLEAKAADLEALREEARQLREERERAGDDSKQLVEAQAELREVKIKLQTLEMKAADLDRLRDEARELREEHERSADATEELTAAHNELRDLRIKLQTVEARAAELERMREEHRELQEELHELNQHREASVELERMRAEHKQALVHNDVLSRRVEELERAQADLMDLRSRLEDVSHRAEEADELRERARGLEAQLFAAGHEPKVDDAARRVPQAENFDIPAEAGLEGGLQPLVALPETSVAILADNHGLLVAAAGDAPRHEGLAALCGIAGNMAFQARSLLPLGDISTVRVVDTNNLVVNFRIFDSDGDELTLATLGAGVPPPSELLDRAIAHISRAVSVGIGAVETGT